MAEYASPNGAISDLTILPITVDGKSRKKLVISCPLPYKVRYIWFQPRRNNEHAAPPANTNQKRVYAAPGFLSRRSLTLQP
jgi:hypothetical protein